MSEKTVRSTDEPGDSRKMVPQQEVPPEKAEKQEVDQTEASQQETLSSSNTSEAGSPSSKSQGIIPEAPKNSSNLNNGKECLKESSSADSSNTDPLTSSPLQHNDNNQVEEKRSAENGVTGDPQLDERLMVAAASDGKGISPCAKDAGVNNNTETSSAVHVNNVDVVDSSVINNDFNTPKSNFSPSSKEFNCGSTKQKRKADECVALDSTSGDDVLKEEGQRQVKKLKTTHINVLSSSVKNGLCPGSKDAGYTSDDSMGADDPDALECNSDEETKLLGDGNTSKEDSDCTSQDVQTEKNKESGQKIVIENATVNGRADDDAMNTDSTKSDAKNNSFEDGDGTLVIQDVTSQSESQENGTDEVSKKLVTLDESPPSSPAEVQNKEGLSEIEISSVSSVGISNSAVHENDIGETNNKLVILDKNSSKSETQQRSPSKCENSVPKLVNSNCDQDGETTLSRTSSLTELNRDDFKLQVSGEGGPKSEIPHDSDLDMQCITEDLSDAQNVFYKKLNYDFNLLIATTQAYLPRGRGGGRRGGGRRGGYSSPVIAPPTSTLATPVTFQSRGRGRGGRGSITTTTPSPSLLSNPPSRSTPPSVPSAPIVSNNTSRRGGGAPSSFPSISPRSSTSLLPKRNIAARNYREESPEIEVVSEKRTTPAPAPLPQLRKELPKKPISGASCTSLLNILARPRNMHPVAIAVKDRKELDVMVKSSLVKNQQSFTEWLFSLRLIKDKLTCSKHPQSTAIRLGAYQSPTVLPASGGYVWMVECCPGGRRYVSVYSGSVFAIGLKENISATSVLKLIYHWSCQTTISNVENWVKVSRDVIGRTYHYLRCVCSVILQDKLYDMGARGTTVELGIVSLGTTSPDGAKKAVKVEILGLYDRSTEAYRLYASSPQNNANSSQRFMRILKPVLSVVHHNAVIVCDYSIDRTCLPVMNYKKVEFCNQNQEGTNENSNSTIMSYLRKHVPKMFQNSLSQLSLEQVQLVLDELCWRETFGRSPSHSYTNMMKQLGYLTTRESDNNGLLALLDFVALNPHKSWRYVPDHTFRAITVPPASPPALNPESHPLPPIITISRNVAPTVHPAIDVDSSVRSRFTLPSAPIDVDPSNVVNPLLHENKMVLSIINNQVHPIRNTSKARPVVAPPTAVATNQVINRSLGFTDNAARQPVAAPKPTELVDLVPHFYGEVPGDDSIAKEKNFCDIECHKCHEKTRDNISFYEHMKTHLFDHRLPGMIMCRYCILQFPDDATYQTHIKEVHSSDHRQGHLCRICMVSFERENFLVTHMMEKHVEAELPYRCEVCNYATSYYTNVIDHFIEKHRGTPYIQCHFCLMVKVVSPGNVVNMALWLLTHLVEHAKGVRCSYCVLSIKSKSKKTIAAHMVSHVTYKLRKDLVRYPSGNMSLKFPSLGLLGRQRISPVLANPISGMRPAVAMSRLVESTEKLEVDAEDKHLCKECEQPVNTPGHFGSYQSCTLCPYATSCSVMMPRHNYVFHPWPKTRRLAYEIGPPIVLSDPLVCNCGFASTSGNHLACHLASCCDSTKTAYPPQPPPLPIEVGMGELPTLNMLLESPQHQRSLEHFLTAFDAPSDDQMQSPPPNHNTEAQDVMCLIPSVQLREM